MNMGLFPPEFAAAQQQAVAAPEHIKTQNEVQKLLDLRWWRPDRCSKCLIEPKGDKVFQICGDCKVVKYCSRKCQKAHWSTHKPFCQGAKRCGLRARWYKVSKWNEIATKKGKLKNEKTVNGEDCCQLCERTASEDGIELMRMECCGNLVCDREQFYQINSFSKAFCSRSHRRYSACSSHAQEKHGQSWRTCRTCTQNVNEYDVPNWRSSNEFNFCPPRTPAKDLAAKCVICHEYFLSTIEGSTNTKHGLQCAQCTPAMGGSFNVQGIGMMRTTFF